MKTKKLICVLITICIILMSLPLTVHAEEYDPRYRPPGCSEEYASTEFYKSLWASREIFSNVSIMERVAAIALSQQGYNNYSLSGTDIRKARSAGNLWTGRTLRNNSHDTGNTEYTRWAQTHIMGLSGDQIYYDLDWCAIFVSWCMFQAGYYSDTKYARYYYSYCADCRAERYAIDWTSSFNFDQNNVWYTPKAKKKLDDYARWNKYVHTNIDPFDIPYKQGGLVFFTWNGTGEFFDHIGIVIDYDPDTHVLQYISGNDDGVVIIHSFDLDEVGSYKDKNVIKHSERIIAYAEYSEINVMNKKELTADCLSFTRDRNDIYGISIHTNSDSDTVTLKENDRVIANNGDYGICINSGDIVIPPEFFLKFANGKYRFQIVLSDGVLDLELNITEKSGHETSNKSEPQHQESGVPVKQTIPEIKLVRVEPDVASWEKGSDKSLSFHIDSLSETVKLNIGGLNVKINDSEAVIDNSTLTLSSALLERIMKKGKNYMTMSFEDGSAAVVINVKDKPSKINITPVSATRYTDSGDNMVFKTMSSSSNVKITSLTTAAVKVLNLKNGLIDLDKRTISELTVYGENTLTLQFADGNGELKINIAKRPDPEEEDEETETQVFAQQSILEPAPEFPWGLLIIFVLVAGAIVLFIIIKLKSGKNK